MFCKGKFQKKTRDDKDLWRPNLIEPNQIHEYHRHVFRGKCSPTCAYYSLKRFGIDNEGLLPIGTKAIHHIFFMDDLIISAEAPEEATEVFNWLQPLLSKDDFELKKWFRKNDEGNTAKPEDFESTFNTKPVDVEPITEGQTFDDSFLACRCTKKRSCLCCLRYSTQLNCLLCAQFSLHMAQLTKNIWD